MYRSVDENDSIGRPLSGLTRSLIGLVLAAMLTLLAVVPVEARPGVAANTEVLLDTTNTAAVRNGATRPVLFKLDSPRLVTLIQTYHWNGGRGARGGWISLQDQDGRQYGPWQVTTSSGHGGAPDVFWNCSPNAVLPAGAYKVVVSDNATWSSNAQSKGRGFARVEGMVPAPSERARRDPAPQVAARPPTPEGQTARGPSAETTADGRVLAAALAFRGIAAIHFAEALTPADRASAFADLLDPKDHREHALAWSHFFDGTLVFLGRNASGNVVTAFYNPFYDVTALIAWDSAGAEPRMRRAALTGAGVFHGGAGDDQVVPPWLSAPNAPRSQLSAQLAAFAAGFKGRYPPLGGPAADRELPPDAAALRRIRELGGVQTAALVALRSGALPDLTRLVLDLRGALTRDDAATLETLLPAGNAVGAGDLLKVPVLVRAGMVPAQMFPGHGRVLIALTNPRWPHFLLMVLVETMPQTRIRDVMPVDLLAEVRQ